MPRPVRRQPAEGGSAKVDLHGSRILILNESTRGMDVGARKEIYNVINDMAARGVPVIMVSSEPFEVLGMSDRVMAVHEGRVPALSQVCSR